MTAAHSVLVVDDDDDVRGLAVDLFEDSGFVVYDAADGLQALAVLADHADIAVLVSDVRMPGMSGVELAREAQRRRPDLKVVLTSGYIGGVVVNDVPVLPKPYRMRDLEAAVSDAISDHERPA